MKIEIIDGIRTLSLDLFSSMAIVMLMLLFGNIVRRHVKFFRTYCIPDPVIGGFAFALIMLFLNQTGLLQVKLDMSLQNLFMYAFFVTIGLGTSLGMMKKGGKTLIIYLIVCWSLAFIQNGLGAGLAILLGVDPLLGLAAGAAALEGGHGMAAAMTPPMEAAGGVGALTVGMAAATYGLIAGSLLGGPVGNWLIKRHKVKIETDQSDWEKLDSDDDKASREPITGHSILMMMTVVFVILLFGTNIARWITEITGFTVPGHVFSLFVGLIYRFANDRVKLVKMNFHTVDAISHVSLVLFLTMAMMGLKIWELYELAIPLIIMLVIQTVVIILIAAFILFKALGKDYDAALLCAGFIGHGLGATANGLAVMDAVSSKYGVFSKKAFIIVPVAGSMLIDIVGVPAIVFFTNLFAH